MRLRLIPALLICVIASLVIAGQAGAAIENGNFEKGDLSGWSAKAVGKDKWRVYDAGGNFNPPIHGNYGNLFDAVPDPLGKWSPVIDQKKNPGTAILYRTVKVPEKAKQLKLSLYWVNHSMQFFFGTGWNDGDNQYFSVDVTKAGAKAKTNNPNKILGTLFAPVEGPAVTPMAARGSVPIGTPQFSGWKKVSWKVPKDLRGEQVQIRMINSVFLAPMPTGIDNVKFTN